MDAMSLLREDHQRVKKMFSEVESTTERGVKTRDELFTKVKQKNAAADRPEPPAASMRQPGRAVIWSGASSSMPVSRPSIAPACHRALDEPRGVGGETRKLQGEHASARRRRPRRPWLLGSASRKSKAALPDAGGTYG